MDYPFTSWTAYYAALTESLNTEYFGETYPEYEIQMENDEDTNVNIVRGLLEAGCDPQEGLDRFIQALLTGHRYASEMGGDIDVILHAFTEKGAKPKFAPLFEILYPEGDYFEDEVASYEIRGILIDSLTNLGFGDFPDYEWASIEATHWEKIDKDIIKEDYEMACYMYLKYCSELLQEL